MTNETLLEDLENAARIAREGSDMPLCGGPIGLLWGVLITVTMGVHYLIAEQIIDLPYTALPFLWIAFGVIGGAWTGILRRRISGRPGTFSAVNRVEVAVWIMFCAMILTAVLGIMGGIILTGKSVALWGLMVAFGFLGQGIAYGTVARLKPSAPLAFASFAATLAGGLSIATYDTSLVYLIGSVGSLVAIVIPNLMMRKA